MDADNNSLQLLLAISIGIFWLYCMVRIISKTGYPGLAVVVFMVPILNLLALLFLIFTKWPVEDELDRYRKKFGELPPPGQDSDESEIIPCPDCDHLIDPWEKPCPECGWTYSE